LLAPRVSGLPPSPPHPPPPKRGWLRLGPEKTQKKWESPGTPRQRGAPPPPPGPSHPPVSPVGEGFSGGQPTASSAPPGSPTPQREKRVPAKGPPPPRGKCPASFPILWCFSRVAPPPPGFNSAGQASFTPRKRGPKRPPPPPFRGDPRPRGNFPPLPGSSGKCGVPPRGFHKPTKKNPWPPGRGWVVMCSVWQKK